MASQVLSGSVKDSLTYTNNTGQNVRLVINYIGYPGETVTSTGAGLFMSWGNSLEVGSRYALAIGKGLAYSGGTDTANNMFSGGDTGSALRGAFPTELALAPGQTFNVRSWYVGYGNVYLSYNILIIPENG